MTVETKSMEGKKIPATTGAKEKVKALPGARIALFFSEIKGELKRVTWTTKGELWVYTKIVVAATVIFGLSIYFIDLLIQSVLQGLSGLFRFLGA